LSRNVGTWSRVSWPVGTSAEVAVRRVRLQPAARWLHGCAPAPSWTAEIFQPEISRTGQARAGAWRAGRSGGPATPAPAGMYGRRCIPW
jgi:hypothetical protein